MKASESRTYLQQNQGKVVRHTHYPAKFTWNGRDFVCRYDHEGDSWHPCGPGSLLFRDEETFVAVEE